MAPSYISGGYSIAYSFYIRYRRLLEYFLAGLGRDPGMGGDINKIKLRLRLVLFHSTASSKLVQ